MAQVMAHGRWEDGEEREALELGLGGCAQLDAAARDCLKQAAAAAAASNR